jgi:formylmethanofuran dehydrogenase subunit C
MSGLTFRLKSNPGERLNISELTPSKLAKFSMSDVAHLKVGMGKTHITVGDAFAVSGSPGDTVTIEGAGAPLDFAGAGLDGGTLRIDGDVGPYAGRKMSGGTLEISGTAGNYLGSCMAGGTIRVRGSAGDNLGGILSGDRFGMAGGIIVVGGNIGARAGDKMRRGTVIVKGKTGDGAGTRMMGGTIWAEGGFGAVPGLMMRRGTLVGPSVERLLPTFADCGVHDLLILRILARHLKQVLGPLAPPPMPLMVRKIAGDMSTIGKGEILLPA